MRDGVVRRAVKWVARTLGGWNLALLRRASPPRYRLTGTCNGCGQCCEAPAQQLPRALFHLRALKAFIAWWERVVNGFALTGEDPRLHALIFRCTHYDPVTKRCDAYESRPLICRDYPLNLTHEATPQLFDACSHRLVDRKAAELKAALVKAGVTGDALAKVSQKLYLDE